MKKLTAVLLLSAGALLAACGKQEAATPAAAPAAVAMTKIVVGLDDNFPPMGFRDEKNELVGFDIDMAREAAKRMGVEVEFKPIDWASKETELNSGRIDCIWNGFTMTPERTKKLAFTKPYMDNIQVYAVLNDSAIKTPEDLKGKKISIQEASTAETALNRDENFKKSFYEI